MAKIEMVKGVDGSCLYINNYRVAGSKPCSAGPVYKKWEVSDQKILDAMEASQSAVAPDTKDDEHESTFRILYKAKDGWRCPNCDALLSGRL